MSIVILAKAFQVAVHSRSNADPRRLYPPPGRPPAKPEALLLTAGGGQHDKTSAEDGGSAGQFP